MRCFGSYVVAALLGAALLVGCGVHDGATIGSLGPLQPLRVHGQVVDDVAGLANRPGEEMDFDVYVVNHGAGDVHVVSARPIAVTGHPAPTLAHLARERGVNAVGVQRGWPPSGVRPVDVRSSPLPPGLSRLAVGVRASRPGTYLAAGVTLTYTSNGRTYRARAYGGAELCVAATGPGLRRCVRQNSSSRLGAAVRRTITAGG